MKPARTTASAPTAMIVAASTRSASARAPASAAPTPGMIAVSNPACSAHSMAGHARSAKTRTIRAANAPRRIRAASACRLLPFPETPDRDPSAHQLSSS